MKPERKITVLVTPERLDRALRLHQGVLPPLVATATHERSVLRQELSVLIRALPTREVREGYWQRASELRARLLANGAKAPLADALVARSCLDRDVARGA